MQGLVANSSWLWLARDHVLHLHSLQVIIPAQHNFYKSESLRNEF